MTNFLEDIIVKTNERKEEKRVQERVQKKN